MLIRNKKNHNNNHNNNMNNSTQTIETTSTNVGYVGMFLQNDLIRFIEQNFTESTADEFLSMIQTKMKQHKVEGEHLTFISSTEFLLTFGVEILKIIECHVQTIAFPSVLVDMNWRTLFRYRETVKHLIKQNDIDLDDARRRAVEILSAETNNVKQNIFDELKFIHRNIVD